MNLHQAVKNEITRLQQSLGLSQNKLAKRLGYAPGYLSMVANGKTVLTSQAKERLIKAGVARELLETCCPTCGQALPPNGKLTSEADQ